MRFQIKEKLRREFREAAMKRFGYGKGALSKAAKEDLSQWISTVKRGELSFEGGPCGGHRRAAFRHQHGLRRASTRSEKGVDAERA